jgi:hypothetical protein
MNCRRMNCRRMNCRRMKRCRSGLSDKSTSDAIVFRFECTHRWAHVGCTHLIRMRIFGFNGCMSDCEPILHPSYTYAAAAVCITHSSHIAQNYICQKDSSWFRRPSGQKLTIPRRE